MEQQVRTNDVLGQIQTLLGEPSAATLTSWIGTEVRALTDGQFTGSPIEVFVAPSDQADRADLVVRDKDGAIVQRLVSHRGNQPSRGSGFLRPGPFSLQAPTSFPLKAFRAIH